MLNKLATVAIGILTVCHLNDAQAQEQKFTVIGQLSKETHGQKIYFSYNSTQGDVLDSLYSQHGKFRFEGTIDGPQLATLLLDSNNQGFQEYSSKSDKKMFYLDGETIMLASDSTFKQATIENSAINREHERYKAPLQPTIEKIRVINTKFFHASAEEQNDPEYIRQTDIAYYKVEQELIELQKKYIRENPNSIFSLRALSEIINVYEDVSIPKALFDGLSPELRQSKQGKSFQEQLDRRMLAQVGDEATEIALPDQDGRIVRLSDYKGKYVLVDFWASWCGPCREESPFLVELYKKYKSKNFEIIGISLDKQRDAWLKAVADDQLSWVHLSDLKAWGTEAVKNYGIVGVPQNFLISPDGKIVAKNLRGDHLEKTLLEFIK
ncbi:redoxin domain-containing protein [Sphingobacterium faecale]|uniref:AhpC/TSA family protein n=1 Tax=Sphingobacterium faecale TaxID=2803775 RepID=A0ABS1R753_9SPHI|nr:TlpA disulfide reductase family protein [Sphingobacterium faecale]MBL1410399.1 AhpC/TSA family protein [Sphingobacterium faecale]